LITSIEISNFLSYDYALIPLGPLTVIYGENLSGKTTIKRAVEWCLLNEGSFSDDPIKDTVRRQLPDGSLANEVWVKVSFSDGSSVTRLRSSKPPVNTYTLVHPDGSVDEIPTGSVGSGFVQSVGEFTGFLKTIWPNNEKEYLQFSNDANNGRFLLSDTVNSVDTKLGAVMGVDVLERATKQAATKATSASRSLSRLEKELADKVEELKQYANLDEALLSCEHAFALADAYNNAVSLLSNAKMIAATRDAAVSRISIIGDGLGTTVDEAAAAVEFASALEKKFLTAKEIVSKLESSQGLTEYQISILNEAIESASSLSAKYDKISTKLASITLIAESIDKNLKILVETNKEIDKLDKEMDALLATITVCPVDGRPHQLCPWRLEKNGEETV